MMATVPFLLTWNCTFTSAMNCLISQVCCNEIVIEYNVERFVEGRKKLLEWWKDNQVKLSEIPISMHGVRSFLSSLAFYGALN